MLVSWEFRPSSLPRPAVDMPMAPTFLSMRLSHPRNRGCKGSSRSSLPLRSKTRNGACGARAVTAKRARSGAEGDCAAGTRSCGGRPLAGCRSVEQDGAWSRAVGLPAGGARARRSALACGTRAPTLAARCGAQTFGLRGGASDLGASCLLMQQQSAAAWAGTSSASSDAVMGMTV